MGDDLDRLELEMAAEGDVAVERLHVAYAALEAADARLAGLTRPTWDRPGAEFVGDYETAERAVIDAAETVEAYTLFPPAG